MEELSAIVVGAGVMGMSTACALAGRGAHVTVLERHSLGHDWSSSHGLTRAIRHEYGEAAIYTRMVALSLPLWNALARETGHHLYTETGVLTLGQHDDGHTLPGYEVMRAAGLLVERLDADECRRRFPQFEPAGYGAITYNPTGGMLHASECLLALADRLLARGGTLREGAQVTRVEPLASGGRVTLADGETLSADRVIVTAGPWIHELLPDLLLPVVPTRQQVMYMEGLPAEQFGVGAFPVFLAGMEYYGFPLAGPGWFKVGCRMEYYGFPLAGPGWFKVGCHTFGERVDPSAGYPTDEAEVDAVRAFLRRVIPAAAEAPLTLVDRCMYDVTPDEDFILDLVPGSAGVLIGSGFSGHGFKFGVLIGELLAALALGEPPMVELERFRLARFAQR